MAKGVFEAWEIADLERMLKAETKKREQMDEEIADPESRLLREALLLDPPGVLSHLCRRIGRNFVRASPPLHARDGDANASTAVSL